MNPITFALSERRRLIPIAILATALAWLATGNSIAAAQHALETSRAAGPIGFMVLGTGLMCLFVPKTIISIAAGGLFGGLDGAWILTATALISALTNYHIGQWTLPANRARRGENQSSIPEQTHDVDNDSPQGSDSSRQRLLNRISTMANQGGLGFHLAVRLTPVPTTIISYTMGAASARQVPYAVAAVLASIPQWLWVYCGAVAASPDESAMAKSVGIGCSVAAAVVLSVWVPRHVAGALQDVCGEPGESE
ncbi:MAG: TVP38/TMEM64 family protein [Rhodopirellula sp. JB044]|uniref:TVP38/TMEM64 family protein n=1 Tax=Rhodopirellula sp. JB044 TaxID=3342844 RepID=UPI00370A49CB